MRAGPIGFVVATAAEEQQLLTRKIRRERRREELAAPIDDDDRPTAARRFGRRLKSERRRAGTGSGRHPFDESPSSQSARRENGIEPRMAARDNAPIGAGKAGFCIVDLGLKLSE